MRIIDLSILGAGLVVALTGCGRPETPAETRPSADRADEEEFLAEGQAVYQEFCAICHFAGEGDDRNPPMIGSAMVENPDPADFIRVILFGQSGPTVVAGREYDGIMPPMDWLSDEEVAAVATWTRQRFGGVETAVDAEQVEQIRADGPP